MAKISDYMREGADMLPQNYDSTWFTLDDMHEVQSACAEGCAGYAMAKGQAGYYDHTAMLAKTLQHVMEVLHPVTGLRAINAHDVVCDLNDNYKWSVKDIAEWLGSIGL